MGDAAREIAQLLGTCVGALGYLLLDTAGRARMVPNGNMGPAGSSLTIRNTPSGVAATGRDASAGGIAPAGIAAIGRDAAWGDDKGTGDGGGYLGGEGGRDGSAGGLEVDVTGTAAAGFVAASHWTSGASSALHSQSAASRWIAGGSSAPSDQSARRGPIGGSNAWTHCGWDALARLAARCTDSRAPTHNHDAAVSSTGGSSVKNKVYKGKGARTAAAAAGIS